MKTIGILVFIGLLAGIFSGMLGIGGSTVMIPLMVLLLGFTQHQAQGTSLAVLAVPVTLLAAYTYYEQGYVNWRFALVIALAFALGGFIGGKIAVNLQPALLKRIFGGVLLLISLKMIVQK